MKKLPEVNVSLRELNEMHIGIIRAKLLLAGIELKVFNHLSEFLSADAVAKAISAHPANTRLFLDGLVANGLVAKKNGLYRNTPIAQEFLVESSPTFLGQLLILMEEVELWNAALEDLPRLIKEGPPPPSPEVDMGTEERWAQAAVTMANSQRSGMAQQIAKIISQLPEFPTFKRMLDLSGGAGIYGIAIAGAHPSMKGVIFDRPAMVKVAETFIKEYGLEDRMGVMGGDYTCDPIGDGYDLIWASSALNFVRDDLDQLTKKIYDALGPGGVFVSYHEGLTHERTEPDVMALPGLPMAMMGQDIELDQGFIADAMLRVGFKSVRSHTLDTGWGPMDLDIGRKA
jgi:O-methyltransferase.